MYADSQRRNVLLAFAPTFICYWSFIFYTLAASPSSRSFNFQPGFFTCVLLHFLPFLCLTAFACASPNQYTQHWRGMHAAYQLLQVFVTVSAQQVLLWVAAMWASRGAEADGTPETNGTPDFRLQAFFTENFYFLTAWCRVITFHSGLLSDMIFAVLSMLAAFAGNGSVCRAPLWGSRLTTLSPPLRNVAQTGCTCLLAAPPAHGLIVNCPQLSCPALLAFWQVLGCALACSVALGREVWTRRAFLKSSAVALGPSVAVQAARWPLGSAELVHSLVVAGVAIVCSASLGFGAHHPSVRQPVVQTLLPSLYMTVPFEPPEVSGGRGWF